MASSTNSSFLLPNLWKTKCECKIQKVGKKNRSFVTPTQTYVTAMGLELVSPAKGPALPLRSPENGDS